MHRAAKSSPSLHGYAPSSQADLAAWHYNPITPPSLRVITMVAERGRPAAP
jgi:hypothetical protein